MAGNVELPVEVWQLAMGLIFYTGGFYAFVKLSIKSIDKELLAQSERSDRIEVDVKDLRENRVKPEHIKELKDEIRADLQEFEKRLIDAFKTAMIIDRRRESRE